VVEDRADSIIRGPFKTLEEGDPGWARSHGHEPLVAGVRYAEPFGARPNTREARYTPKRPYCLPISGRRCILYRMAGRSRGGRRAEQMTWRCAGGGRCMCRPSRSLQAAAGGRPADVALRRPGLAPACRFGRGRRHCCRPRCRPAQIGVAENSAMLIGRARPCTPSRIGSVDAARKSRGRVGRLGTELIRNYVQPRRLIQQAGGKRPVSTMIANAVVNVPVPRSCAPLRAARVICRGRRDQAIDHVADRHVLPACPQGTASRRVEYSA